MSDIPDSHPRAASLRLRERLVEGLHAGITTESGLIAHGRGEALDYLLGERTHPFAERAIAAASARVTLARHPVITVNGNVAALAGPELAKLAAHHPRLVFEVNLFHHTPERARQIVVHLENVGLRGVLDWGTSPNPAELAGLDSSRRHMHPEGVAIADVVVVPLEDGDRCQALVASGRKVIAIDLNPLSRTAQMAHVTIVDELTRVVPLLDRQLSEDRDMPADRLRERLQRFDNLAGLEEAIRTIREAPLFRMAAVR
jgi:4-phosphopantoate--beta-alanine ligase